MALKRKALYMGQMEKLNGARLKLEEQMIAIEGASTNLIVLDAMSEGAQTMKQINRQMCVTILHLLIHYQILSLDAPKFDVIVIFANLPQSPCTYPYFVKLLLLGAFVAFRTIEKVEEINDEIQDQMLVAEEIGQAIAMPSGSSAVDEDELEAELNLLEQEILDEGMASLEEPGLNLPDVPQKGLPVGAKAAPKQQAVDHFDSLSMEMNM